MTRVTTTLVTGQSAAIREAAIVAALDPAVPTAVIAEGLPDAAGSLDEAATSHVDLSIVRIAAGCPCCSGNLVMRVTLNRVLRQSPERLYISLANDSHLAQIRNFLLQEPYRDRLSLTKELAVSSRS